MFMVCRRTRVSIVAVGLLLCAIPSFADDWRVAHWNVLHGWGRYWNQPGQDGVLWPPSGPFSAISDDGGGPDGDTYGQATAEPSGGCGTAPYLATWSLGTNGPMQTLLRSSNLGADPLLVAMTLSEGTNCISAAEVKTALAAGNSAWSAGQSIQYGRDGLIAKYGWASPAAPSMTIWDPVANPGGDMVQIFCRENKYQAVHGYIYTDAARTPSKAVHLFATRVKGDSLCETQRLDEFVRAKAGANGRILIMGDFNFEKGSTRYDDLVARSYVESGTSPLLPAGSDKDALTCCFGTDNGLSDGRVHSRRFDMGFQDNLPYATSYWVGNQTVGATDEVAMSDHAVVRIGFTETGPNGPPPAPWSTTDVGSGVNGSTTYANGTFSLTAGGTDLWSTSDDFHFVHQSLTGDGEIVANVAGIQNPSGAAFSLAAVMMRASLTGSSAHASMMITNTGKAKFRRRLTTGGDTVSTGPSEGSTPVPRYLKLKRAGNVFSAFLSTDGTTWTEVAGSPATIALPSTVYAGLVALRNGSTAPSASITMNNVTVQATAPPSTWQGVDVGAVGPAGSDTQTGASSFSITAGGDDVWAGADAFHFVYQPMSGDGEISAFISDLTLPTGAAFSLGGVMIRADLSATAMHATMMTTTQNKAKFRRRVTTGATTTLSDGPSEGTQPFRTWVKVKRVGDTFTAYLSSDGVTWNQVGPSQVIAMPANTLVGILALRNGAAAGTMTGTFTNIAVVP